jgi:hypothetical protein
LASKWGRTSERSRDDPPTPCLADCRAQGGGLRNFSQVFHDFTSGKPYR